MADNLARISKIEVKDLFGLYNHSIELRLGDRITVIHGPNGVGKTMLLKLVNALFEGRYMDILRVSFKSLRVILDDGTGLLIVPHDVVREDIERSGILVSPISSADNSLTDSEISEPFFFDNRASTNLRLNRIIQVEFPWLERAGSNVWVDERTRKRWTATELLSLHGSTFPESLRREIFAEPEWLTNFRKRVKIYSIETQRLLKVSSPTGGPRERVMRITPMVQNYAELLKERISEQLAIYANESQTLDESFPQRLLAGQHALDAESLTERMQLLIERRTEYRKVGLGSDNATLPFNLERLNNIQDYERSVISLYADDSAKKLDVLSDLAGRIKLLLDIVNHKFLHKRIDVLRDDGIVALDENGQRLNLDALSSGEQHELVLAYDLLFTVLPNSLVMIDEPELSLHVTWQKAFIPDLQRIISRSNFDVLVATHSPFIVGDNTDLMVSLSSGDSR